MNTNGFVFMILAVSCGAMLQARSEPAPDPAPSGLVAWWRAEGDATEVVGQNNGTLVNNVAFAPGEVGQAFNFDGIGAYVFIPASPRLNVGTGSGITIDAWINPTDLSAPRPIFEWSASAPGPLGAHFYTSVTGPGDLYANLIDTSGNSHSISSSPGVILANGIQHVALTYDESTGNACLYLIGFALRAVILGVFTP
jgi:hypothetical protein